MVPSLALTYNNAKSVELGVRSRKAVGSLIGISFLLMILAVGFSYYNIINRIENTSNDRIQVMTELAMDAADEDLEITSVKLTVGNSLNLTIKNTGNEFSELEWVGVFDDTLGTQEYYRVDANLNPVETQKDIGNASIVMDSLNDYTIQVLTRLGNVYYAEYPEPVSPGGGSGGGGNETQYFFVDNTGDAYAPTETGTHSLFSAMQGGPDGIFDTLTEGTTVGGLSGFIDNTIVDTLEFDTLNGQTPSILPISGDVYAIAFDGDGDDGFLTTVEMTSSGAITNTVVDTLEFDIVKGKTPHMVHVSGDVYAIAYAGNGDDGFLVTVEIASNGAITNTVLDSLEFNTLKGKTPHMVHVSGDVYAIAYAGNGDDGFLVTVEIASNGAITNTLIDSYEFDTASGKTPVIMHISGDVYAIAYEGVGGDGFLITVTVSAAGSITAAPIDSLEYDTAQGKAPDIILVSGNTYAIAYSGAGDVGELVTVEILTDGNIGAAVIDSYQFLTTKGKEPDIHLLTGDIYIVVNNDDQGPGNPKPGVISTIEILANGDIGAAIIDSFEFDVDQGKSPVLLQLASDVFAVAFEGVDSDGFLSTINFLSGGGDYLLDLEVSWIGLPSKANEYLTIYGGTMGAETLLVDYWDGGAWVNLIPSVANGWNIVDVSSVLTGSSFTIRFVDATQTSDAVQDTWEIDFAYLNLFD
jgi:hypothetical protein